MSKMIRWYVLAWLCVAVALLLSTKFWRGERDKSPAEKWDSIQMGMAKTAVLEILGTPALVSTNIPHGDWDFGEVSERRVVEFCWMNDEKYTAGFDKLQPV